MSIRKATPLILIPLLSAVSTAWAQNASGASGNGKGLQLEEVIVTAQHKSESLQDAAIAVNAISASDMLSSGITDMSRLNEKVPALVSNGVSTFIRGVGTFSILSYTDPAIAFNYDGVYIGRTRNTVGLFFDIERVEVLKGPQGILYGRNATGGALNVLPVKPSMDGSEGQLSLSYGEFANSNFQGGVNIPVGDNSAVRVSMFSEERDGLLNDGADDKGNLSFRTQFATDISDALYLRLAADWTGSHGKGGGRTYTGSYAYDADTESYSFSPSGLSKDEGIHSDASQAYLTQFIAGPAGRTFAPLDQEGRNENFHYGANAELIWSTDAGVLTIIPAWRHYDLDTIVGNPATVGGDENGDQYSLEARFAGTLGNAIDYSVGGFLYKEDLASDLALSEQFILAHQQFSNETESWAAFANVTFHVSDQLRLVAGARHTMDKKAFESDTDGLVLACVGTLLGSLPLVPDERCPTTPLFSFTRTLEEQSDRYTIPQRGGLPALQTDGTLVIRQTTVTDSEVESSKVTWRAAIEYDVTEDSLLYLTTETGFRSGGFSAAAGYETYAPEEIIAYTLGMKNQFFDRRAQLNLEAFAWEYRDQQLGHVGEDSDGATNFLVENAGSSSIYGMEIEGKFLVAAGTEISSTVQYLDSVYDDFVYERPLIDTVPVLPTDNAPPPNVGCPYELNETSDGYTVNCSGYDSFNSPDWTFNLGITQFVPLGDYNVILNAETQWRDSYFIGFEYLDSQSQASLWRSHFTATLTPSDDDGWAASGFVRNIEDSRSLLLIASIGGAVESAQYSEPRTYGLRLTMKF